MTKRTYRTHSIGSTNILSEISRAKFYFLKCKIDNSWTKAYFWDDNFISNPKEKLMIKCCRMYSTAHSMNLVMLLIRFGNVLCDDNVYAWNLSPRRPSRGLETKESRVKIQTWGKISKLQINSERSFDLSQTIYIRCTFHLYNGVGGKFVFSLISKYSSQASLLIVICFNWLVFVFHI